MNEKKALLLSGLKIALRDLSFEELKKVENFIIFNLENEKYQRSDKNFTDR
jgi:hypothetical protein